MIALEEKSTEKIVKTYAHLFQELDSYSKRFLESQLNKWQAQQTKQYDNFAAIFSKVIETIDKAELGNPYAVWIELAAAFRDLNDWIKTISTHAEDISLTFADWHEQTQHFFSSFPVRIEEEVNENIWLKNKSDSFYVKSWKFQSRRKNQLKKSIISSTNVIRKVFRRPALLKSPANKSIKTQEFFNFYFTLPFLSSLYDIWQNHLQLISSHLAEIHKETEQMVHPLYKDIKFEQYAIAGNLSLVKLRKQLTSLDQIIKDFLERYNVFKKGTLSSNKQFLAHLKDQIDFRWKFAGTFILPVRKFKSNRFQSENHKFQKKIKDSNSDWQNHIDGEKTDWQKDNELSMMQLYAGQMCHRTIISLRAKLDALLPAFIEPQRIIENALRDLKASKLDNTTVFKEKIMSISRTALRKLHREKLPQLADAIVNTQFEKIMENYLSQMENELETLSEEYTIFRYQDLVGMPPASKFIDIPLKDIITEEIFSGIEDAHKPEIDNLSDTMDRLIRSVSENDQIIELNFDTALELLESDEDHPLNKAINVATQGLERAEKQLIDLIDESNGIINKTINRLATETLTFETQIQNLSDNDKIIALKIRAEKAKTKDRIRENTINILTKIKRSIPGLLILIVSGFKKIQDVYLRLRKISGLTDISADAEDQLSQFLYHISKKLKGLPYVYQRLFRFQSLDDDRFFAGREKEMDQLRHQLEHWKKGNFALTALVGEKGSGRTTILNFAENDYYNNQHLVKIDLTHTIYKEEELFEVIKSAFKVDKCSNLDELEHTLQNRESSSICVIENLHNMFLRIPDGFMTIERFLLFISNTHHKIHWIVTCGIYSWHYLDKVLNIQKFFHRTIFLPQLSSESIQQLILKRHRVSGYKLFFETPPELEKNRKFKKLTSDEDRQNYLNTLFFEKLSELSAGNITVAFMFWLSSIKDIKDDYLTVSPVIEFEALFSKNISGDDLFTFAAFVQHETLTATEHALIFNQDLQKSLLLFNRLKNKGMLTENINGYQVHYLLYKPVVRALKINNLL